ncbi:hypothetical protein TVAG_437500 [Trichomonas vaginalis G3]|uniref:Uncharacterized protein n=1 Tax=Trichomonas vaginalis (strain ATCC PRA-98 / G3) TaxID=412133 RepID=A2DFJ6_TRIV3|nr:hypothetical protein TVAGG3_0564530 [Trichomonas vaginalis G3]EAY20924.1 hypothetical protein TVAG_437500 [Trichomonas vaginalis G3]KAI5521465.1 hypothetical protein TVAGG3_0564530 [Trichomonas vaginalis G3]|eukprot:XP_001581910.1 hypothetical protein [Trichomonas vaginalis G3]
MCPPRRRHRRSEEVPEEPAVEEKKEEQVEEKQEQKEAEVEEQPAPETEQKKYQPTILKISAKVGSNTFLHLDGKNLYLDTAEKSQLLKLSIDITDKVLSFSLDEKGVIRIFTSDGNAITVTLETLKKPTVFKYAKEFFSASIFRHQILAIISGEYRPILLDFKGNILEEYTDIQKQVRFCIFTSQLKAVADSTLIYVKKSGEKEWHKSKYRDFYITHLINVNRQTEFGITTKTTTRVFRKHFQSTFRPWATDTVALLQCPSRRHFYAHLNNAGLLRIGDNEGEYSIQENGVTGICWDMGMLWARNNNGKWHKCVLSFDDQLFDMRAQMLKGLETPLEVPSSGNVINVLEAIIERPAMSSEIMTVLPPIAQKLRQSTIINDALKSLDTYISKSGQIDKLLGQIDLALSRNESEE